MSAKYEIKQAKDGKFYFNLKASNGQRHRISEKNGATTVIDDLSA